MTDQIPAVVPATQTPPVVDPPVTDATKAYSDLHNSNKELQGKFDAQATELTELRAAATKKADGSKDSAELMTELNDMRSKNEALTTKVKSYHDDLNKQIETRSAGLTEAQKNLVKYSSDDPFAKLNFINELQGQAPVIKNSQGDPVVNTGEISLDIQYIANQADMGNLDPLHAAYKAHGKEKVQAWIVAKTTQQPQKFDLSQQS